jgi:predicted GIY-YIG superfamily endonuclease
MKTALYRHFNAQGQLLYVGITCDPVRRTATHFVNSDWAADLARIEVEWHDSKKAAIDAECRAIRSEQPVNNCGAGQRKKSGVSKPTGGIADNSAILDRIARHLDATGETRTAFGMRIGNDYGLLNRLAAGHEPRQTTIARIEAALSIGDPA